MSLREVLDIVMTSLEEYGSWLALKVKEHHSADFAALDELPMKREEAERLLLEQPVKQVIQESLEGWRMSTPPLGASPGH